LIRVTIELIPYGAEAMAKTIAELCIEQTNPEAYEAAGYEIKSDNKIKELAKELKIFPDNGVLALVAEILKAENITPTELSEQLIQQTRLYHQTLEESE
jgi:hypothetical protein